MEGLGGFEIITLTNYNYTWKQTEFPIQDPIRLHLETAETPISMPMSKQVQS